MLPGSMVDEVTITAWDGDQIVTDLSGATDVSTTSVWGGVGDGDLTNPEVPSEFNRAWFRPGRIVIAVDGPQKWRGFVTGFNPTTDAEEGAGMVLEMSDGNSVLDGLPLLPEPELKVAEQSKESEVLQGPAYEILQDTIRLLAQRFDVPIVVAEGSGTAVVEPISFKADYKAAGKTLREAAETVGLAINARIWLPGDPLPAGVSVPAGGVIVTIDAPRQRHWVTWEDTDLESGNIEFKETVAGVGISSYEQPSGSGTETETRNVYRLVQHPNADRLGMWSGLAVDLGKEDKDDPFFDPLDELATFGETMGASAKAPDGGPFYVGVDYDLGDEVRVAISGIEATAIVTQIEQVVEFGVPEVQPSIGEPVLPPEQAVIREIINRS